MLSHDIKLRSGACLRGIGRADLAAGVSRGARRLLVDLGPRGAF